MSKVQLTCVHYLRAQVLHHCDVAAWMKFCLEHPQSAPNLRFRRTQIVDSQGNVEREYGEPCTSKWQEEMEDEYFPGGMPDGVDIVGCMHAFDVMDVLHDGSRKSGNFYGAPAGVSKDARGIADFWPPIAYFPQWKHRDTDGAL